MATYKQIQDYVKQQYGYIPKSCWIAHMKEVNGLNPKMSPRQWRSCHSEELCYARKPKQPKVNL
ncbi:hypothetical protein [Paenibacillus agricola]|uniref:Uncharacterized protein n=1 Tax=Paenibacillus agricola TaxID=2716264 RepID=A0ABX0JJ16_9BACL|nr:hypothetical protein [Paenibacillus agricola]NHN35628.1 hypothetical protein [Paenibacillus agricola]